MDLHFFPVGYFPKERRCPGFGEDAGCQGDKYEACVLQTFCGGPNCSSSDQIKLANFLACYEGGSSPASFPGTADKCAALAGFDVDAIKACDGSAAFEMVQEAAAAGMANAKCFPWIVIDGVVQSKDPSEGCFGKDAGTADLLGLLCAAMQGSGRPAGCSGRA